MSINASIGIVETISFRNRLLRLLLQLFVNISLRNAGESTESEERLRNPPIHTIARHFIFRHRSYNYDIKRHDVYI